MASADRLTATSVAPAQGRALSPAPDRVRSSPLLPWLAAGLALGCLAPATPAWLAAVLPAGATASTWIWWAAGMPLALVALLVPIARRLPLARRWCLLAAMAALGWWMAAAPRPAAELPALTHCRGEVVTAYHWGRRQGLSIRVTAVLAPGCDPGRRVFCFATGQPPVRPGDRVTIAGCLRPSTRPGRGPVIDATRLVLDGVREHGVRGWAWRAIDRLDRHRALAGALLLGRGRGPARPVFAAAGLLHLLAVSGLHLGLALGLMVVALRATGLPWIGRQVALVAVAAGYLWLTGGNLSTQRALAMVVAWAVAGMTGRRVHPATPLALAVIVLLLLDPGHGRSIGFQLSAAAVAGIVTLGRDLVHLRRRLLPLAPWPLDLAAWRGVLALTRWSLDGLAVGIGATLAVVPLVAWYFGTLAPFAPLATVAATPAVMVVVAGGLILFALTACWPYGPWEGVYVLLEAGLDTLMACARGFADLPGALIFVDGWPPLALLLWPVLFVRVGDGLDAVLRLIAAVLAVVVCVAG